MAEEVTTPPASTEEKPSAEELQKQLETLTGENQRLSRKLSEHSSAAKEAERLAKQIEDAKAKEEGRWSELLEAKESELKAMQAKVAESERRTRFEKVAERHVRADARDLVFGQLEPDDMDDERTLERSLKKLVEERPFLKKEEGRPGAPMTPRKTNGSGQSAAAQMDQLIRQRAGR